MSGAPDISQLLPPSLDLPPHLSAHKYFFVCTLTVAAWDTLVLSPRTWRLLRSKEWPILKIIFHFLRLFMPIEFTVVAVAFFDTRFTSTQCDKFFLFEPICTAILVSICSLVHVIRVSAIYDSNRVVQIVMSALLGLQVIAMGVLCGFWRPMPLEFSTPPWNSGQGCVAGPKFNDREVVGLYWLLPTVFYTVSFVLACVRSFQSLQVKQISYWKLMLRDGLNLYGAIWIVNMVNVLFWFIVTPDNEADTIKTIVSSMAAVLTTTMTLRIILSIRGPLAHGGTFNGSASTHAGSTSHTHSASRGVGGVGSHHHSGPHNISTHGRSTTGGVIAINPARPNYTIGPDGKEEARWGGNDDIDNKSQNSGYKEGAGGGGYPGPGQFDHDDYGGNGGGGGGDRGGGGNRGLGGVKVTIDRQTHGDYHAR